MVKAPPQRQGSQRLWVLLVHLLLVIVLAPLPSKACLDQTSKVGARRLRLACLNTRVVTRSKRTLLYMASGTVATNQNEPLSVGTGTPSNCRLPCASPP